MRPFLRELEVDDDGGTWQCQRRCSKSDPVDVALAKRRLLEGFAFVGLAERWALSVCLLHVRFGGRCDAREPKLRCAIYSVLESCAFPKEIPCLHVRMITKPWELWSLHAAWG